MCADDGKMGDVGFVYSEPLFTWEGESDGGEFGTLDTGSAGDASCSESVSWVENVTRGLRGLEATDLAEALLAEPLATGWETDRSSRSYTSGHFVRIYSWRMHRC